MPEHDYRRPMSRTEFAALGTRKRFGFDTLYDALIVRNTAFGQLGAEYPRGYGDPMLIPLLTPGQQIVILLGAFDGQVSNGGLAQFFWNCPEYVFPAQNALLRLGCPEVAERYDRAIDSLDANYRDWLALRARCYESPYGPRWVDFAETYELLDLDWFDRAYFDTWSTDATGAPHRNDDGLHNVLLARLVQYVMTHPEEFITG